MFESVYKFILSLFIDEYKTSELALKLDAEKPDYEFDGLAIILICYYFYK